jgi:putative ABC transport system substrate-binding protein
VTRTMLKLMACFASMLCWMGVVHAAGVAIVLSERSPGYTEAAEAMVAELARGGVARSDIVQVSAMDLTNTDVAGTAAPKVFVTLGAESLQRLLNLEPRAPVVAALIPRSGFERVVREWGRKASSSVTALYLDQPFGRQLDLMRLALPARRVGVIWGPESVLQQSALVAAGQARGMAVSSGAVALNGSLFAGLKAALDDADVLLAVADPQVFNSGTVANILLATYRARIPVLAFSPAYVKAGALLSLHTAPDQIGVQAAGIVRSILLGGVVPAAQYPLDFRVSVNVHVARSLGLTLDEATLSDRLRRMERRP